MHSKKNHKQNERQPKEWEKIFTNDATQTRDFQNRQTAYIAFKKQQTNNPIKEKNGQKI